MCWPNGAVVTPADGPVGVSRVGPVDLAVVAAFAVPPRTVPAASAPAPAIPPLRRFRRDVARRNHSYCSAVLSFLACSGVRRNEVMDPHGKPPVFPVVKVEIKGDFTHGYREVTLAVHAAVSPGRRGCNVHRRSFDSRPPGNVLPGRDAVADTGEEASDVESG